APTIVAVASVLGVCLGCAGSPFSSERETEPSSSTAAMLSVSAPPTTALPTEKTVADNVSGGDWRVVGLSVQSRPIRVRTVGHGPRRVLFVGGIHGNEPEGIVVTESLPEAFSAAGLNEIATLTILEDANPDGRAAGTRGNAN